MIRKHRNGITAQLVVIGELSEPQEMIRQGCPLASLLFLLASKILALAIRQDKRMIGRKVPNV